RRVRRRSLHRRAAGQLLPLVHVGGAVGHQGGHRGVRVGEQGRHLRVHHHPRGLQVRGGSGPSRGPQALPARRPPVGQGRVDRGPRRRRAADRGPHRRRGHGLRPGRQLPRGPAPRLRILIPTPEVGEPHPAPPPDPDTTHARDQHHLLSPRRRPDLGLHRRPDRPRAVADLRDHEHHQHGPRRPVLARRRDLRPGLRPPGLDLAGSADRPPDPGDRRPPHREIRPAALRAESAQHPHRHARPFVPHPTARSHDLGWPSPPGPRPRRVHSRPLRRGLPRLPPRRRRPGAGAAGPPVARRLQDELRGEAAGDDRPAGSRRRHGHRHEPHPHAHLRPRCRPGRRRWRARRPHPQRLLPDGLRRDADVFHRGDRRRAGEPPRHPRRRIGPVGHRGVPLCLPRSRLGPDRDPHPHGRRRRVPTPGPVLVMTSTETRPQAATTRTLSTGARIGLGAAVVAATAALGMFGPPGIRSLTVLVMILSIYAVSYGVLLGFVDLPSLGQSLFFGVGAYCAILPLTRADWSLWAVLGTSLVVGLALAFVTGTVAVRLSEAYHVIVTALFGAVAQLAADNFTPITGGEGGLSARIPPLRLGPWEISVYDAVPAFLLYLAFAVVAFLLMYGLVRSPIGTVWKAIRDNQDRALSAGYNVYAYKL